MKHLLFFALLGTLAAGCGNSDLHGGEGGAGPDTTNQNIPSPAPGDTNAVNDNSGRGLEKNRGIGDTAGNHGSVSGSTTGRPTGGTGTTGDSLVKH
jgi:hypothetical protein